MNLALPEWFGVWVGLVAIEIAVLLVGIGIIVRFVRSASMRRWLWQAGILAVISIAAVEIAGWRRSAASPLSQAGLVATVRVGDVGPVAPQAVRQMDVESVGLGLGPVRDLRTVSSVHLDGLLLIGWAIGTGGLMLWMAGGRWALWRRNRRETVGGLEPFGVLAAQLGVAHVRVRRWRGITGPVAFGLIRPTVAVPEDFEARFNPREREAMMAHELSHVAGRDPAWFLLMDLLCALGWWHPALWWARRGLRTASEQVADEGSGLIPGGRIALAEALVGLGRTLTVGGGVGVGGSGRRSELARRVEALLKSPEAVPQATPGWRVAVRLAVGLAVLGMAVLPVGVRGGEKAQDSRSPSVPSSEASASATKPATQATVAIPPGSPSPAAAEVGSSRGLKLYGVVAGSERERSIESKLFQDEDIQLSLPVKRASGPYILVERYVHLRDEGAKPAGVASPTVPTRAVPILSPSSSPPPPAKPDILRLEAKWVELREGPGSPGWLDWIFGRTSEKEAGGEQVGSGAAPAPAIVDGIAREEFFTDAEWRVLDREQHAALIDRFEQTHNVDLLSAPVITTVSGRQAEVAITEVRSIVVGPKAQTSGGTNQSGAQYESVPFPVGTMIDLVPRRIGDEVELSVLARYSEFLGYDEPKKGKNVGGVKAVPALPRVRIRTATGKATFPLGQTLILRGPAADQVVRFKSRVPVLGSVPLMGRLFRSESVQTNRTRVYVLIHVEAEPEGSTSK
jgi:beta-lactamase regulating signal transducer with metallopeptidase domain